MKYVILLLSLLFISCDDTTECCAFINASVHILVTDKNGNDLLIPKTANAIDFDKIKIFYLINNIEKEVFYPNLDTPRNIILASPSETEYNNYCLILFLNTESDETITTTIIEWPDQSRDHIKAQIERNGGSTFCSKLWHNDILVWEENGKHLFFEILK